MNYHTTISLPQVRAAQLRHVAEKKGTTALEMIDALVRGAWSATEGEGACLPGFELAADLDCDTGEPVVVFHPNNAQPIHLTPAHAQDIATCLRDVLNGVVPRFEVDAPYQSERSIVAGMRKGRGFILQIHDDANDLSRAPIFVSGLTATIAEDLAASFDAYALQALVRAEQSVA